MCVCVSGGGGGYGIRYEMSVDGIGCDVGIW